ncbi:ribonuclease J [Candidatus Gracilibacteria bacterium]|nr:ribonuclease J [Candidatus Gracilibacteria bacterium]
MKDFLDELDQELENIKSDSIDNKKEELEKKENTKREGKKEALVLKKDQKKGSFDKEKNNKGAYVNSDGEIRGKFNSNFPETKFYLPSLRKGYTRYMPIGGNNEIGAKNMGMVQYGDDILIIDCGVQFADKDMLGVNYSIPDVSFLTKYKKEIKAMLITHAHLDHIGSLKHVMPALGMPTLYATKFTLGLIRKILEEAGLLAHANLIEVDALSGKSFKIGGFKVEYFNVNHSVPDCAGIYLESEGGTKIVHTGDFKIDHTPVIDKPVDLDRIKAIGDRGISLFLSDSTGSTKKGFSMSEKNVGEELERIVANHKRGRLIIATFSSWISRVQQLVDICEKYDKTIFLSGRSMIENVAIAKELGYLKIKQGIVKKMTPKNTDGILPHKQIIVTTGSQGEEFSALSRMAEGKHTSVEIIRGDTIIFSSSIVPGNEKSVVGIINKLIKLGARVITKDDGEVHTGGHAFQEEQKIFLNLIKPKYFSPIFGDLYFRTVHANTAIEEGFKEENILMLDNGNIVDFAPNNGNVFRSRIKAPIQELVIDGHGMGLANSHVIKAREKMMNAGVLVVAFKVDKRTKAILGHIKLETRGLVYLEEVRFIHRMIIKKTRDVYENTVKDVPDMEEKDLIKILRVDLEKFLLHKLDREPMIIPMIMEV